MIDGHIHIERGEYTLDWINRFVDRAVEMHLDEIRLLEHCYRFEEFVPMYDSVCVYSEYVDAWFHKQAGVLKLEDYLELSKSNMYADQNSGVARRCPDTGSLGMEEELLKILKKNNVKIITSSDAHCPEDVGYKIRELYNGTY